MRTRKLLALVMSMMILISGLPAGMVSAATFSDMPQDWSTPALERAVQNGLLTGANGQIMAKENLTRAQMATVINRAFGAQTQASISHFTDVSTDAWYHDEMAKAVQMKTFQGSGNNLDPESAITREQAFLVMARALKLDKTTEAPVGFTDLDQISSWAREEVYSMIKAGYIKGSDGKVNPKATITRAEFAQLMDNLIKHYINQPGTYTEVVEGNIMINVPGVTLTGVTITGDLILGDGIGDGEITLDDVIVQGRLVVRGGGENSIVITGDSDIQKIIIARVDGVVRVYNQDGVEIGEVIVDGSDDVILQGDFVDVLITAPDVDVYATQTTILTSAIEGENSRLIIGEGSSVGKVVISAPNVTVEGEGSLDNAEIKDGGDQASVLTKDTLIDVEEGVEDVKGTGDVTIQPEITYQNGSDTEEDAKPLDTETPPSTSTGSKPAITKLNVIGLTGENKAYDGTAAATATGTAILSGGLATGDDVSITGTPTFTFVSANVGTDISISTSGYSLTGADSGKYSLIQPTLSADITAKELTIGGTFTAEDKVYDSTTAASLSSSALSLSGVLTGDSVSLTSVAIAFNSKNANCGTASTVGLVSNVMITSASLTGIDAANYTLSLTGAPTDNACIFKKPVTISGLSGQDKTYDGTTAATVTGTALLVGTITGDDVGLTGTETFSFVSADAATGVAIYAASFAPAVAINPDPDPDPVPPPSPSGYSLTGTDAGNYALSPITGLSADINPKELTITGSFTADNKTYDGTTDVSVSSSALSLSGVVSGDTVSLTGVAFAFNDEDANCGTITPTTAVSGNVEITSASLTGIDAGNYFLSLTGAPTDEACIYKKEVTITGSFSPQDKTYDGTTSASISSSALSLSGVLTGDSVSLTGVSYAFYSKDVQCGSVEPLYILEYNVGIASASLTGTDAGNYALSLSGSPEGNACIYKKELTVTADNKTVTYGNATPSLTYTINGYVTGEDSSDISGSPSLNTTYTLSTSVSQSPVTISITSGSLSATNYSFSMSNGSITINKANPSVTSWPSAGDIARNQMLSVVSLTGGSGTPTGSFAFVSPSTTYTTAGTYYPTLQFTPNDTVNYNTASTNSVAVDVLELIFTDIDINTSNGAITLHFNLPVDKNDYLENGDFTVVAEKEGELDQTLSVSIVDQPNGTTTSFDIEVTDLVTLNNADTIKVIIKSSGAAKLIDLGNNLLNTDVLTRSLDLMKTIALNTPTSYSVDTVGGYDVFKVNLTAGHSYMIWTSNSSDDPHLYFYSDAALTSEIDSDDDGMGYPEAMIIYTPSTSGTYYIQVREHGDDSTCSGTVSASQI